MIIGNIGFELMAPYLKELRASTFLVMTTRDPINAHLADKACFFQENSTDFRPLYAMALDNQIDTVISISGPDFANLRDSRLRTVLDRSGIKTIANKFSSSKIAADKLETKVFLEKNGFPFIKGHKVDNIADAREVAGLSGYPVAVKQIALAGGTGFFVAYSESELMRSILTECDFPLLIEEYIPGHEFSVEVLNYDNKPLALNPVYKGFTMPCGIHPMERLKTSPPPIAKENAELLKSLARKVVSSVGLEPTGDVDFVWSEKGLKILEINPRFGGITALSMASTDINSYKLLVDMAIGNWRPEKLKPKEIKIFDIPVNKPFGDDVMEMLLSEPNVFRIKRQDLKVSTGRVTIQACDIKNLFQVIDRINNKCDLFDYDYLNRFLSMTCRIPA